VGWGGHGLLLGFCLIVRHNNNNNNNNNNTFIHIIQYCYCISICLRQARKFITRNSWVYYLWMLV
jgi:hypothetical protein